MSLMEGLWRLRKRLIAVLRGLDIWSKELASLARGENIKVDALNEG
jgi:hypothetical protein